MKILEHCDYMCSDSTGSSELCWAFGEHVKFVMKYHMTIPPTTTQPPTTTSKIIGSVDNTSTLGIDKQQDEIDVDNWGEADKPQETSGVKFDDVGENKIVSEEDSLDMASKTAFDDQTGDVAPPSSSNDSSPLDEVDQSTLLSISNGEPPTSSHQLADQPVENLATSTFQLTTASTQSRPHYSDSYYSDDLEDTVIIYDEAPYGQWPEHFVHLPILLSLVLFAAVLAYVVAYGRPVTIMNEEETV